ncbi:MAG: hypothetical protein HY829_10840, partial [Actinobacteria bacterium]|nr:hypothetical protein [Actinomycetota bacterium]
MLEVLRSLVNVVQKRPRDQRRLMQIRTAVYRTVAQLHAEIVTSPEPILFADLEPSAFRTIRPGTAWGRKYDCAWLHVTGRIPDGVPDPVVLLGIRGEGLVHSAQGEVVDSVSTVWIQGDLPHSGGVFRPVTHLDLSAGNVDFYADVAYNGWLLFDQGKAVYHGALVAARDDEAYGLYYDYLTLVVLSASTDDRALAADLDRTLALAYSRFTAHDIRAARAILADVLGRRSESDFTYSAIGHGHLDMAWLWPLRETRRKAARTYVR